MLTTYQKQQEIQKLFIKYLNDEITSKFLLYCLECFIELYPDIQTYKNSKKDILVSMCKHQGINPLGKKNDLIARLLLNKT